MSSISLGGARARMARAGTVRPAPPHDGPEPWVRRDVVVVAVVLAAAVSGLVVGWLGVSDTVDLDSQTRWLGFGITALIVGGFGMVFWLLLGLRRVAVLRRTMLTELDRRHPQRPTAVAPMVADRQEFGTATGMRRYHAAGCQMLADKDGITWADESAHIEAGLRPCPICTVGGLRPPTTQPRSRGEAPS